jgi:hypothetical protein
LSSPIAGEQVYVYYIPAHPASAVQEPGAGFLPFCGARLGVALVAIGAIGKWM